MSTLGYTGVSYPFRVNKRGGITMSTTTLNEPDHVIESMQQILMTSFNERVMEGDVGSNCQKVVFKPNDPTTHGLLRFYIIEALNMFEPRIKLFEDQITIYDKDEFVFANIPFALKEFGTTHSANFEVGKVAL